MIAEIPRRRMLILALISLGAALLLILRYGIIMLGPESGAQSIPVPTEAERGPIVDRRGRLLALQTRLYSVTAWKPDVEDASATGELLGEILKKDVQEISRRLSQAGGPRFLFIERKVTPTQSNSIRSLMDEGRIPGIGLQEERGRHYPMKESAAALIGYVGTDNVGLDGIEYAFDKVLAPGALGTGDGALQGHTVHLTLDMNAQQLVERIAEESWREHNPDSMILLVMNAKTGEFLTWVSLPSFNPNTFTKAPAEHRMNRPLTVAYEPGSVFKVFTWSIFLEKGNIGVDDIFATSGGYKPELFRRYDIPPINDLQNYGTLTPLEVLIHSSNVGSAMASDSLSNEELYTSLKNFGFGAPTNLPIPGESHGLLNSPEHWSVRTKPTIAFGQEVGVSAVQVITAATVFANSGVLLRPVIISKVTDVNGNIIKEYGRTPLREVISPRTARTILNMMEQTVTSPVGTARRARVSGLRISAKSGTAQVSDPETGTYSENRFLSSVLALFPTNDPRLIVYVVLENPQGYSYYGGRIAAPIIKKVAETLSPLYGIPLEGNTVIEHPGTLRVKNPEIEALGDYLPDMTGYSKRMLLPYLAREDINWTVEGNGWVYFQFPEAGTPLEPGMSVYLRLK